MAEIKVDVFFFFHALYTLAVVEREARREIMLINSSFYLQNLPSYESGGFRLSLLLEYDDSALLFCPMGNSNSSSSSNCRIAT